MDYIISVYPKTYLRYLIHNVNNEVEAWDDFFNNRDLALVDEGYVDDDEEADIEEATPELRKLYGLEENME